MLNFMNQMHIDNQYMNNSIIVLIQIFFHKHVYGIVDGGKNGITAVAREKAA